MNSTTECNSLAEGNGMQRDIERARRSRAMAQLVAILALAAFLFIVLQR